MSNGSGGNGGPHDHPGLQNVVDIYKAEFGATAWQDMFVRTVQVVLNYKYNEDKAN